MLILVLATLACAWRHFKSLLSILLIDSLPTRWSALSIVAAADLQRAKGDDLEVTVVLPGPDERL